MSRQNKPALGLRIVVQNVSAARGVPGVRKLSGWVKRSLQTEASGELSIRIVDEAESATLNSRYRGKQKATNVLSFAGTDAVADIDAHARVLGDVVICAPVVAREAAEQAKPLDAHWAHIVLHGVLHLLGYDHESNADAEVMEARERELLATLGFDDPYAGER